MATWTIEIHHKKGEDYPWKAAIVAKNGRREEVGEFLNEKEARSYAQMELTQMLSSEGHTESQAGALQAA